MTTEQPPENTNVVKTQLNGEKGEPPQRNTNPVKATQLNVEKGEPPQLDANAVKTTQLNVEKGRPPQPDTNAMRIAQINLEKGEPPQHDTNAMEITQMNLEKGEPPQHDGKTGEDQGEAEVDGKDLSKDEGSTVNDKVATAEETPKVKDKVEKDADAPKEKVKKVTKTAPKAKERRTLRKRKMPAPSVAKSEDKTMFTTVDVELYDGATKAIVENLVTSCRFVRDGAIVKKTKSGELKTVNRLLLHGLRNLHLRCSDTSVPNAGKKAALLGCIEDVRRGCVMVDTILTAKNPDVKKLRMTTCLVTIGTLALRDEIGGAQNCST